jgi:hypothetical protein
VPGTFSLSGTGVLAFGDNQGGDGAFLGELVREGVAAFVGEFACGWGGVRLEGSCDGDGTIVVLVSGVEHSKQVSRIKKDRRFHAFQFRRDNDRAVRQGRQCQDPQLTLRVVAERF